MVCWLAGKRRGERKGGVSATQAARLERTVPRTLALKTGSGIQLQGRGREEEKGAPRMCVQTLTLS
jgi:hypothetical protein